MRLKMLFTEWPKLALGRQFTLVLADCDPLDSGIGRGNFHTSGASANGRPSSLMKSGGRSAGRFANGGDYDLRSIATPTLGDYTRVEKHCRAVEQAGGRQRPVHPARI